MVERAKLVENETTELACFLRSELGYQSESPGALRMQVEENRRGLREIEHTLRGQGGDMGLVGWVNVLRRTWITLVALLGAALGYVLNDVVETFPRLSTERAARSGAE